jgi:release factor glutamine methyltransferase
MDLGTGTGAIALALASERPKWQVWGADRIPAALDLAKRNAKRLQLEQITWLLSDWFEKVPKQLQFDLIISNPPYIDNADPHLQQGDVRFEPHSALVAAEGGLADIKLICAQAHNYLAEGGWLLIEHGWQQADAVAALFDQAGFTKIELIKDMSGNPRSTLGCWQLTN